MNGQENLKVLLTASFRCPVRDQRFIRRQLAGRDCDLSALFYLVVERVLLAGVFGLLLADGVVL